MTILLNINIINKNYNETYKRKSFSANFDYSNNSNKFSLKQYEKEIENNLIDKIIENSILWLSEL